MNRDVQFRRDKGVASGGVDLWCGIYEADVASELASDLHFC